MRINNVAVGGFLFVSLAVVGFLPARQAGKSVDTVLDRYVKAIGGSAAVERVTSRVSKGSLQTPAGNTPVEIREKAPNKILRIIDSPTFGHSENGFDGTVAWLSNPRRGVREMSGPEAENLKRELTLHRQLLLKQLYSGMRVAGQAPVDGQAATVIEAQGGDTASYKLYFDQENGLLVRVDTTIGGATVQNLFQDYRDVDGIKLPFMIRHTRTDGLQWTEVFSEIQHNVSLDDAQFARPADSPGVQRQDPIPDTFTNLQVLPKDISKRDLVEIMKNFSFTMDKRCSYCHVATDDLSSADFPSDEKETKKKARVLLRLILAAKKSAQ